MGSQMSQLSQHSRNFTMTNATSAATSSAVPSPSYQSRPWKSSLPTGVALDFPSMPYQNLSDLCVQTVSQYASSKAFTICLPNGFSHTLTFAQVDTLSDRFAAYLRSVLKLEKGERVALQTPNCLAFPIAAFGIFKAGCVLVNVNPLYTKTEMEHQFNDAGVTALVIIDMFADKLPDLLPKTKVKHVITCSLADFFPIPLRFLIQSKLKISKQVPTCQVAHHTFSQAIHMGRPHPIPRDGADALPTDIAVLQYTGGTTGVSKGAVLTHSNILANVMQIRNVSHQILQHKCETMLTALPCYHIFAFTVNFLSIFSIGNHNILIPSPRPLINLKKAFEKFNITWLTGVNTLYNGLADEPWFKSHPPKNLKASIAGGTALQNAVAAKWTKVTQSPIFEGYGLTESSPVLTINPIGSGGGPNLRDTVGLPLPGTWLRCVDESGNDVPLGEPGELIAKAPQVMAGYYNRPADTAKTIKDGWLYTGDIGIMDSKGYFRVVDRKKDMILVSGFNVYPNEVEDVLAKHPDIQETAVVGVPDAQSGELVKAFVVCKPGKSLTLEQVREFCKTELAAYKVPKQVEFRNELPKTNVGKILRKNLRDETKVKS
jgi:long-chain acyl-CoA synthetase